MTSRATREVNERAETSIDAEPDFVVATELEVVPVPEELAEDELDVLPPVAPGDGFAPAGAFGLTSAHPEISMRVKVWLALPPAAVQSTGAPAHFWREGQRIRASRAPRCRQSMDQCVLVELPSATDPKYLSCR